MVHPVSKFQYFGKYVHCKTALWLLLPSYFWSKADWFGEIKQFHEPLNYGVCDADAFMFFAVFKNLKSSFSEDNMPIHALEVFNENATKMVELSR